MRIQRTFLPILVLGGWAAFTSCATAAPAKQPNIIFIFTDDHSLQTIGAYDSWLKPFCKEQNVTPNLDRLAAQGGLFVNSFCGNSLCSPSRATILTGLHSHANGVTNLSQAVRSGVWTFPGAIGAAGYQTAVIGKWHLNNTPTQTDYWRLLEGQGSYWNADFLSPEGKTQHLGYATDVITDMGLDWLKQRDTNRPFLLMLQQKAPHRPWNPPARYYHWLANVKIPEPDTLFDDYSGRASPARNQTMEIAKEMDLPSDLKVLPPNTYVSQLKRMTDTQKAEWSAAFDARNEAFFKANLQGKDLVRWKYQEYMKDYLRCVKAVDDGVGRIMDYLENQGLDTNTVLIYSSDQGFYNGEHGWFDKRWIYEESLHMPLIVRWPGVVKPGSRFTPMVQNIDYAETFVDIAGGKRPDHLHGRSLVPILQGQTPADWRKSIYYRYYDPGHGVAQHYGVRTERYTLVYFLKTNEWELYDLQKDPQQLRSVYADAAYADTVAAMKTELKRLRKLYHNDTDASWPETD